MVPGILWAMLCLIGSLPGLQACIWDADTMENEKRKRPKMAEAIAGTSFPTTQPGILRERIQKLEAAPRTDDPKWINDLAGAYLRLGDPNAIVKQLEQAVARFPTNYGVHANLGTAYHLLGNYAAAEKEIARDLELNPEAHFGLEKFFLPHSSFLRSTVVRILARILDGSIWLSGPCWQLGASIRKRERLM